ncbi:beta-lactamase family protein [Ferruginibacter lapsinanis]|uniref:serine hydrolase domain-containing protein n=1 Tax=Ferruginibacter lapsinanis TaxID=563172 RepID=UPI001E2C6F3D|nr:serine hydrolase domain-containing protein [Ferruginibacter lapsinanis]UEG49179.1 beta-lactamase family protein [Ferruginibacter lapsinanis]
MLSAIISLFNQISSHTYRILIAVKPYRPLFLIVFSCSACNLGGAKNNAGENEKIVIIDLPVPSMVSAAEKERIYNTSKSWFDTVLKPGGFNGGMIVAKNGNIIFEAYNGTGHLPGNDTITANSSLHIASVSKTFTAMAVLKLWQDGKLKLDDEFSLYFPQFNYPGVTIRSLLSHRSGLPNYTHYMESIHWDEKRMATNEDILNTLITLKDQLPPAVSPNTKFAYCNTNYALLALLIEKVTGKKYSDYLSHTFFLPLQMKHTFVFTMADTVKVPPSYDWRNRLMPFNFLDAIYGDKNIYTTPEDLLIWDRALNSGYIFTQKTLEAAYAPYSNERPGVKNYGLGWRMNIYPTGKKIIFHNGWWHGSNAVFTRILQDSATIIVIGNKYNRNIYHTMKLANLFGDYYESGEDENEPLRPAETPIKAANDYKK